MKVFSILFSLVFVLISSAPLHAEGTDYPGTKAGADALLRQFLKPNANRAALSQALRPNSKDYQAVFKDDVSKQVEAVYAVPWNAGKMVVGGKPEQTALLLWSATTEELQQAKGDANKFPGGYAKAAPHFKPGITFYRFKFVRPGEALGMAWDGLTHVNGHWVIFPKPWRALR